MKKAELVFIPSTGNSHIVPTIEFAKRLIAHGGDRFSITVIIIPESFTATSTSTFHESIPNIRYIHLPPTDELPPPDIEPGIPFLSVYIESFKPRIKDSLINIGSSIVGLVVDMFTTTMIDIAKDLSIPSYMYFTSSAAMVGVMLHMPVLDDQITCDFKDYQGELSVPSFINSIPPLVFPPVALQKANQAYIWILYHARKLREIKGIIVNSISELEPQAVASFSTTTAGHPKVYTVGPLLDLSGNAGEKKDEKKIMGWLDTQPHSAVVFLCFGSRGAFSVEQARNIAIGLERSQHRFLWSLRQPPNTSFTAPTDYTNLKDVLPEGFLERTEKRGLICGWAPQVEILSHPAIGGFVSHCGWNSILESLWFGVPILAWPLYAEQNLNAFQLVRDLKLATEMRSDYDDMMITPQEIESGVRRLMDDSNPMRRKVKNMSEKCKKALAEGGSSSNLLGCFIKDLASEGF